MNIAMLNDRVLIKLDELKDRIGSLYIPETGKDQPQTGRVIAVGPGRLVEGEREDLVVNVGDKVIFGKYAGAEIELDGEKYLTVHESDLIAIVFEALENSPQSPEST